MRKIWLKYLLQTAVLFVFPLTMMAQPDSLLRIVVEGRLIGLQDKEPVPFAHVVNKNTLWGTITDTAGYFSIPMHKFDTLLVSAIGYDKQEYVLPLYVSVSPFRTRIYIRERSYPIDEVEVFVLGTWSQFSEKMESLNIPETEEEKLERTIRDEAREAAVDAYQIPTGIPFSLPSKYSASLEKVRQLQAIEARQIILYRKYNREVIARTTGLSGPELDQFIIFCNQRAWFTPETSAYDIIYQIKIWYRQWLILQRRNRQ